MIFIPAVMMVVLGRLFGVYRAVTPATRIQHQTIKEIAVMGKRVESILKRDCDYSTTRISDIKFYMLYTIFAKAIQRDEEQKLGWRVLIVWECETKKKNLSG